MAEIKEPVSFTDLAIVYKYMDANMKLSEAQIWATELKKSLSEILNYKKCTLRRSAEALSHGLCFPGSAKEKIQAVIDYEKRHPPPPQSFYCDSVYTSPQQIVNELLEALKGNVDYRKAAKSSGDGDISTLSPDAVRLAAQTFMFRNHHREASDEEAVESFHKAIRYLKGEQRTSTEFIKYNSSDFAEIVRCVNRYFIEESIDIIGLGIAKRVMDNINQGTEPQKQDGHLFSWDVQLLSEVDCLRFTYQCRKELFRNRSDDYIHTEWERMGQNCFRWYIFCAGGKYSRREYYAMRLKKTITIGGRVYEFKGDFRPSGDPGLLKRFQDGKINGNCTTEFQGSPEYSWSKDGKPPAHPYFTVAQLYWPHLVRDLKYLQLESKPQVTDEEALKLLNEAMPALKEENTDPERKTYTWFLNKPSNARLNFPELNEYIEGQSFSDDYLRPSTEPLQTDGFSYEWSREEHESTHQDFTLIYRARPTLERVPQIITKENRIRFDYWQYIKEFVFFGGSHLEGAVLAPDPAWIDQAHRNGVRIFGTVFLPPLKYGGDAKNIEELAKPENLQKLVDIAHQLNFEGWFLNIESFEDYKVPQLETLKLAIQKMDLRGKQLIWYLPSRFQSELFDPKSEGVKMTCDYKINNTAYAFQKKEGGKVYLNFFELMENVFSSNAPQNYLMFVDEPFWLNKLQGREYLVNPVSFLYAQNCLWQFFLGENGLERNPTDKCKWYGIAKYAKERKCTL